MEAGDVRGEDAALVGTLGLTVDDSQKNLRNLTRVTDVLVMANILANASVEQFSKTPTPQAGASLKACKKDIEEGVAVLADFADQGIKGEMAGPGLSRVIRLLSQSALQATEAHEEFGFAHRDVGNDVILQVSRRLGHSLPARRRPWDRNRWPWLGK